MPIEDIAICIIEGCVVVIIGFLYLVHRSAASQFMKSDDGVKAANFIATTTQATLFEVSANTGVDQNKLVNYASFLCKHSPILAGQYFYHRSKSTIMKGVSPKDLKRIEKENAKPKDPNATGSTVGIVSAEIVGVGNKKDSQGMVTNAIVGDILLGFGGAVVGASLAKDITQITFVVFYQDGHKDIETVSSPSPRCSQLLPFVKNKQ